MENLSKAAVLLQLHQNMRTEVSEDPAAEELHFTIQIPMTVLLVGQMAVAEVM